MNLGLQNEYMRTIVVDGDYIYAGAPLGKFCMSSDNGVTWTITNIGLPFGVDIQCMTVNNGTIYGGTMGGGVCRSTDNGNTWQQFNNVLSNKMINKLTINGNKIFAATENGVYLSMDNGNSWAAVNDGISNIAITSITENSQRIIVGSAGTGIFSSVDKGDNWSTVNYTSTGKAINVVTLTANGNDLFAGTIDGVFVSHDNGITWFKPDLNLQYSGNVIIFSFAIIGKTIFAGTTIGIYISTDNGNIWTLNNSLSNNGEIYLAVNGNNLYAGNCAGFHLSTDLGASWVDLNNGLSLSNNCILSIGVKENNIFLGTSTGAFRSTNNGSSWAAVNNGLPAVNISNITVTCGNLFAGTYNSGVFLSIDNGEKWTPVTTGLIGPALLVKTLIVIGDEIYAGTDKGIWKRPLSDLFNLDVSANALSIEAPNISKASFNIYANTSWTVSSSETWLTPSLSAGYGNELIELTASENSVTKSGTASVTVSNKVLPDKTVLVTKQDNGSINYVKETENNFVEVYPNPAKEYLIINTGVYSEMPGYSLKILNMSGKTVFETKVTKYQYEINLASWSAKGIYVLQLFDTNKKIIAAKKIILQ